VELVKCIVTTGLGLVELDGWNGTSGVGWVEWDVDKLAKWDGI